MLLIAQCPILSLKWAYRITNSYKTGHHWGIWGDNKSFIRFGRKQQLSGIATMIYLPFNIANILKRNVSLRKGAIQKQKSHNDYSAAYIRQKFTYPPPHLSALLKNAKNRSIWIFALNIGISRYFCSKLTINNAARDLFRLNALYFPLS